MNEKTGRINPLPPFIWPETRILAGHVAYENQVPFNSVLNEGGTLFGVIYDLDQDGLAWLETQLSSHKLFRCKLILALYPACATEQLVLNRLLSWETKVVETSSSNQVEFKLLPIYLNQGAHSNALCFISYEQKQKYLLTGASPNFGCNGWGEAQLNFVIPAEPVIFSQFLDWFNYLWEIKSVSLNEETVNIPPLVPATGTAEGAAMWNEYLMKCRNEKIEQESSVSDRQVSVDEITGQVSVQNSKGEEVPSVTEEMEIERPDELTKKITKIYDKGYLVSFNKMGRIKPLEAPIKAEWLGVDSLKTVGAVTQELRYRISILDDKTVRDLNNKKKMGTTILSKMSFQITTGQRLIPHNAIPVFEKELERINNEGHERLKAVVGGDINSFMNKSYSKIIKDANDMYQELHPREHISEEAINYILTDLEERLNGALNGKFVPDVNYNKFNIGLQSSNWASLWAQPLAVLYDIARYPRIVLSDRFFMRGLKVEQDDLLIAMDICNDKIIKERNQNRIWERAKKELEFLKTIINSESSKAVKQKDFDKARCETIFALIEDMPVDEIMNKFLPNGQKT
jgi:hypothetical protein